MTQLLKKILAYALIVAMFNAAPLQARAEMITTLAALESTQAQADLVRINDALAREQVREQLRALGVDEAHVQARLARLTDSELRALADRFETAPAGAGLLEVVGIVFIVLLILEAVGVTDIFKKFP